MSENFWLDPVPTPGPPDRNLTVYAYGVEQGPVDSRNPGEKTVAWNTRRLLRFNNPQYMGFVVENTMLRLNPYYFSGAYKVDIGATWVNHEQEGRGVLKLFKHQENGKWLDTDVHLTGGSRGGNSIVHFTNSNSGIINLENPSNQWLALRLVLVCDAHISVIARDITFNLQRLQ